MAPKAPKANRVQVQPQAPAIASLEDCDAALVELSQIEAAVDSEQAAFNDRVAGMRTVLELAIKDRVARRVELEKAVAAFCTANRPTVFPDGSRTRELTHGELSFRKHPTSCELRKGVKTLDIVAAIKDIFTRLRSQFIRVKEEVNKEAILAHASALDPAKLADFKSSLAGAGITIVDDRETFGYTIYAHDVASNLEGRPSNG